MGRVIVELFNGITLPSRFLFPYGLLWGVERGQGSPLQALKIEDFWYSLLYHTKHGTIKDALR